MKRSEVNAYIQDALEFFSEHRFFLPPFADFTEQDWLQHGDSAREILDLQLGWDITSFGSGDFLKTGLLLFTLRNGFLGSLQYPKPYAEKIMIVREGQVTPQHFHWHKREDIINRGGGNLIMEVWRADQQNQLTDESFEVVTDGIRRSCQAGEKLILKPGESVCLEPYQAHTFYGETGSGTVLVGEVSMTNDDANDNCFIQGLPRFDKIEEDEARVHFLVSDYGDLS